MNYIHECVHCRADILVEITTAKGSVVEVSAPDECIECGEKIDHDKLNQDVHDYVESYVPDNMDRREET